MSVLEVIGALTVGLFALAVGVVIAAIIWCYFQAALGYARFAAVCKRKGLSTWGNRSKPRPWFYALRMIHFQTWHSRTYQVEGVLIPWTYRKPLRHERY